MIVDFQPGDIFKERDSKNLYLILDYNDRSYPEYFLFSGCDGNLSKMYGGCANSKNQMLNKLNAKNCTKIGSIKNFKITAQTQENTQEDISVWGFKNKN